MDIRELLTDVFGRIEELYADVAGGLDIATLHHRPNGTGNSIAWLLWHAARVQDDHVGDLAGVDQAWYTGWQERFALPLPVGDTGFGHTTDEVDQVQVDGVDPLLGYQADVQRMTLDYIGRVDEASLGKVVDRDWSPPVTAGVRLVSVQGDCLQHLGQAAYLKGLLGMSGG
jgi:hypothetical protein